MRVQEDGHLTAVALPALLRGEDLQITPLRDGWTVAVDRYWPGGSHEEEVCSGPGSSASDSSLRVHSATARIAREAGEPPCSELVVGQLSPGGRWGDVRLIPHSFGHESEASEPVLAGGEIELAWSEGEQFQPIRVAVAALGHDFRSDHLARTPLHREANRVITMVRRWRAVPARRICAEPSVWNRQDVGRSPAVRQRDAGTNPLVRGRVLREPGLSLEGANGSELWLFGDVYQSYAFARRALSASKFERTNLIVKESDGEEQFAQSHNHRTLITLDNALPHRRSEGGEVRNLADRSSWALSWCRTGAGKHGTRPRIDRGDQRRRQHARRDDQRRGSGDDLAASLESSLCKGRRARRAHHDGEGWDPLAECRTQRPLSHRVDRRAEPGPDEHRARWVHAALIGAVSARSSPGALTSDGFARRTVLFTFADAHTWDRENAGRAWDGETFGCSYNRWTVSQRRIWSRICPDPCCFVTTARQDRRRPWQLLPISSRGRLPR